MRKSEVQLLFEYMYWVNHRLLERAAALRQEEFVAESDLTTRSLRATLVHELDVEWSWRLNLQGAFDASLSELEPEDFPDAASVTLRWEQDEHEMREWLEGLTDGDLDRETFSEQTEETYPMWIFLMHVLQHAGQQQADAATLLHRAGESVGDFEFLDFMRDRAQTA